jgi:hypothetical protein
MSSGSDQRQSAYDRFKEEADKFFEAQLERLGLGAEQIQNQDLVDLNDSLARVDDALRASESFGIRRLRMSGNAQVLLATTLGSGKTPVSLARKGTEVPFDVRDYPVIAYPNMRELKTSLAEHLSAVRAGRK